MGGFLEQEKLAQQRFRSEDPELRANAAEHGQYGKGHHPFCVALADSPQVLFSEFREAAIHLFQILGIPWHHGSVYGPTNHLCDSQVSCVNFLYPFVTNGAALTALLKPLFPSILRPLPMEDDRSDQYLTFEWIGKDDYLRENQRAKRRTRGAVSTSVDAATMFECADGETMIVLIEWKYTEAYSSRPYCTSPSGTYRPPIYEHLRRNGRFVVREDRLPSFHALFYEPFYQLFRQQSLAAEMEHARELGASVVRLLHVSPGANADLLKVTSPELRGIGKDVFEVWSKLLVQPDRFVCAKTEALFGAFPIDEFPSLRPWWEYIHRRYRWLGGDGAN